MTDAPPPTDPAPSKRWYQRWWVWAIAALVVLIAVAAALSDPEDGDDTAAETTVTTSEETTTTAEDAETTTTAEATTTTTAPTTTEATTTTTTLPPFEPIVIEGSGNDVVSIDKPNDAAIVTVVGNSAGRYFGVTAYDSSNERISGLVNTTDPYEGTRPLDWLDDEWTARFEVEANGAWTITVLPIFEARTATAPGTISGNGDDVFLVFNGNFDTALITGNPEGRYFGVTAYGSSRDNIVNTTDPFEGRVIVPSDALAFEVEGDASGDWTIVFE